MNNPDEGTAGDQFGNGDNYFGVATLLATMPGLPMFGHGQFEGFSEKYGMEFRRAKWTSGPTRGWSTATAARSAPCSTSAGASPAEPPASRAVSIGARGRWAPRTDAARSPTSSTPSNWPTRGHGAALADIWLEPLPTGPCLPTPGAAAALGWA